MALNEQPRGLKRSPEEIRKLKLLMAQIARLFSSSGKLSVVPGDGWAMGFKQGDKFVKILHDYLNGKLTADEFERLEEEIFKPTSLTYDETWFSERTVDELKGVTRHEVGHANNSDYRLMIKGQRLAKDDGCLPTSYMSSWNAIEDLWVNNREMYESETVRGQIKALYEGSRDKVLEEMRSGKSSLTRQLGMRKTLEWMKNEFKIVEQADLDELDSKYLDPRVVEAYKKTLDATKRFCNPKNSAEANFKIMSKEIWPVIKELEMQDFQDKIVDQLTNPKGPGGDPGAGKGQGQGQGQPGGGQPGGAPGRITDGGGGSGNPMIDKLPPDLKKRLIEEMERQASQSPKGIQGQTQQKAGKTTGQQNGENQQGDSESGAEGEGFDARKMPQDLKEKVVKAIESMPEDEKKSIKKTAKENLDEQQAKEIAKDQPKSMQMEKDEKTGEYIQTPKITDSEKAKQTKRELEKYEFEDRKNQEKKKEDISEKIKNAKTKEEVDRIMREKELPEDYLEDLRKQAEARKQAIETEANRKKIEMEKLGFEDYEEALFDELMILESSAKQGLDSFNKEIVKVLPRKTEMEWEGPYNRGKKIMKNRVAREAATGRYDFLSKRQEKQSEDPKLFVKLIIDRSGSMGGKKMEESLKTCMFFWNVLKELNIPFSITFFDSTTQRVMDFGEDPDKSGSKVKVNLMRGSKIMGGSTNIEVALLDADEELRKNKMRYPGCLSSVFFIGDGEANAGKTGSSLKELVDDLKSRHIVSAYALGGSGKALTDSFGEDSTVEVNDFENLPQEAKSKLKQILQTVKKRFKL
jgi:hypothetical protein